MLSEIGQINHSSDAAVGLERCLEHGSRRQIAAFDGEGSRRPDREVTCIQVEQASKCAGAGEIRQTQPIKRALPRDQRSGSAVADDRVVSDLRLTRSSGAGHLPVQVQPP